MAFNFEEGKKFNWFRLAVFAVAIIFVGIATYYLFFAPTPKISVIIPGRLEEIGEVSEIEFIDPSALVRSQAFQRLKTYGGAPRTGELGRDNPFIPL
jgi:hypothetical protein